MIISYIVCVTLGLIVGYIIVQFIYSKGYEDGNRRLWVSATISPKVSGKYLVTHGGNYNLSLDFYTTMEDAVRIFDEGYEDYVG